MQFAKSTFHTNVIVMSSSPEVWFAAFSCVHKEVILCNRKLLQLMKICYHLQTCNMSLNKIHYTTHGLHRNNMGKNLITNIWAMKIKRFIPSYFKLTCHFSTLGKGCWDLNDRRKSLTGNCKQWLFISWSNWYWSRHKYWCDKL